MTQGQPVASLSPTQVVVQVNLGAGLVVSNSSGDVTIENFNITDTTGPGILAQNNTFAASKGATFNNMTITQTNGSQGVNLSNNSGGNGVTLNNVDTTTATGTGLFATTNEIITMTGTNSVTSTNAAAVNIINGTGNHTLLFSDISSTSSPTNGVFLSGITGGTNKFDVTGGITIDQASGPSLVMQNSTLTANIPTTTITGGQIAGIQLVNMNDPSITALAGETLTFGTASITTGVGTGLVISNTSPTGSNGLITFGGGSIAAANGPAINATKCKPPSKLCNCCINWWSCKRDTPSRIWKHQRIRSHHWLNKSHYHQRHRDLASG